MMTKSTCAVLLLAAALPAAALGPSFDSSGNSLLNGTYYFREVVQVVGDNAGDLQESFAFFGNISFDGNGNYTVSSGQAIDCSYSSGCQSGTLTASGKYTIAASGYGFMTSPASSSDTTYFLVSQGIFIGSATETTSGFNEMIVGAPVSSPLLSNSSFNGGYTMVGFTPGSVSAGIAYNTSFSFALNPNGAGSLGSVGVTGYFAGTSTVQQQAYNGVKYNFTNGAAIVTFPTSSSALYFSGQEYLYFSPDGNFCFGGSPANFDMLIGIKNPTGGAQPQLSGLFYEAGVDLDASNISQGYVNLDTYYGSFSAAQGNIVAADRLLSVFNTSALTSSYSDTYPVPISSANYSDPDGTEYWLNAAGTVRIGVGTWPYLGISVALQAPAFSGSGPYIYPTGIINSASYAPFTAGVANGELITIYGTGLAASTVVAQTLPFPTTLGNVQVIINGVPAPIYYVSPGQIAAIVPSGNPFAVANIQVLNGSASSNTVSEFVRTTDPGVFTQSDNGLGYAAAVHNSTGAVVTPSNPAQPGEYLQIFLTGLGTVYPTWPDGAPGPTSPLSSTVNDFSVYFNDSQGNSTQGTVEFSGLAPTLAGLYQINVQVPSTPTTGDQVLEVDGPDSSTVQALVTIGTGSTAVLSGVPPTISVAKRHSPQARHPHLGGKLLHPNLQ